MTLGSPRALTGIFPMPRSISAIIFFVGGLALFLCFATWVLISNPAENSRNMEASFLNRNQARIQTRREKSARNDNQSVISEAVQSVSGIADGLEQVPAPSSLDSIPKVESIDRSGSRNDTKSLVIDSSSEMEPVNWSYSSNGTKTLEINSMPEISSQTKKSPNLSGSVDTAKTIETCKPLLLGSSKNSMAVDAVACDNSGSLNYTVDNMPPASPLSNQTKKIYSESCDLYNGKWFYDPSGPLYTNNSCPIITQMQNCQGNGRPDKEYENWRWKPAQCELPRFEARKFLDLMRGKTLAFIGDSVARNQMESMLCILWQVEAPKNRGNRKMQRWYFPSTSVSIVRIWSSWLVHQTSAPFEWAPEGVVKLHLDIPDEGFMEHIPRFDVVVLSSGHWFAKQSVYILNNEIVGGQLWWPDKTCQMKVNNVEAFGISVETILTAMVTHPNYTGLTIVRSFSPDHYEGGAWNTGGSCTGKVQPAVEGDFVKNEFTEVMHSKQVMGFEKAIKRATNQSKLRLMDITKAFGFRQDGHPGPYRSPDPNKKTKRGPHGEPPPQDCLHWCMPGPVDIWNELVLEIIGRVLGD